MLLEQVVSLDGYYLQEWKNDRSSTIGLFKGRIPNWNKKIKIHNTLAQNNRLANQLTSPFIKSTLYKKTPNEWSTICDPIFSKTIEQVNMNYWILR
ncbi:hypothetical protein RclHR1_07900002 [Rhizophagus clarus]|uniref:Uncharacterized protein n=1 Tax=Rhizophagus clarus TaxID=94130 RepID=A0A2Z6SM52_9GLOM|nr:hypothetical protein RclHR1_07900002 [Rhizophagus clarus]GES89999.1 hypothetical protein RCL_jg23783.t1 [Rhizophagus clarus]